MAEYIDRDTAIRTAIEMCVKVVGEGITQIDAVEIANAFEDIPTADVAEVVRCKDCKFWTPMDNGISWQHKGRTDGECQFLWQLHHAERHLTEKDHFCGYGERYYYK